LSISKANTASSCRPFNVTEGEFGSCALMFLWIQTWCLQNYPACPIVQVQAPFSVSIKYVTFLVVILGMTYVDSLIFF